VKASSASNANPFTLPEDQVKRLLEINEQVWKNLAITEEAIRALGDPPISPISDKRHLYCVVLLYETGDAFETFKRNWEACVHVFSESRTEKWDGLLFSPKGVKRRENAVPRRSGLRWSVAEPGRDYQGVSVRDVRLDMDEKGVMGMSQELPFVAAMHPRWVSFMNGGTIPFVDAPDLEIAPDGGVGFNYVPYLYFFSANGKVKLNVDHVDNPLEAYGSGSLR
jgi:hypothetical protein